MKDFDFNGELMNVWKGLRGIETGSIIYKGVKYEDFIATVGDFAGGAKADLAKQAYKLWGEEKWNELYQLFKTNDLNNWNGINWPPFNGAQSILKTEKGSQL